MGMDLKGWTLTPRNKKVVPFTAVNTPVYTKNKCATKIRSDKAAKKFHLIQDTESLEKVLEEGKKATSAYLERMRE